jgi:hypothetical protein
MRPFSQPLSGTPRSSLNIADFVWQCLELFLLQNLFKDQGCHCAGFTELILALSEGSRF